MKKHTCPYRDRGFTLVELLVVIVILAVLFSVVFMFARKGIAKASASKSLSRLRESGAILLADVQEKNGKLQFAADAGQADSPYLPYNIVRANLGLEIPESGPQTAAQMCEIMHWDPAKLKPAVYPQNCYGVNFTNIPNDPEGFGVTWADETLVTDKGEVQVRNLVLAGITRPEFYPFLMDSSDAQGNEVFRIRESEAGYVGLRNNGKAHAYFLDGSARELGPVELKAAGFTRACDNSITPPTLRSL